MGSVMMSGVAPNMKVPISGIPASELAVGSVVKLMEGGVATEYLVVNQGKPSGSSLYDDSCDGVWLLRKDIKENRQWNSSNVNDYENSTIHSYLNRTFLGLFDADTQSAIKQVKLPYRKGSGYGKTVTSGASGLSAKIFLLSSTELSFNHSYMPTNEGAELSYFAGLPDDSNDNKRKAKLNGSSTYWWLRSPYCNANVGSISALCIDPIGGWSNYGCSLSYGIRPALVLPGTALFDKNTLILNGVA